MISDLYFLKKTKYLTQKSIAKPKQNQKSSVLFCIYSISSFIKLNTAISQSFLLKLF